MRRETVFCLAGELCHNVQAAPPVGLCSKEVHFLKSTTGLSNTKHWCRMNKATCSVSLIYFLFIVHIKISSLLPSTASYCYCYLEMMTIFSWLVFGQFGIECWSSNLLTSAREIGQIRQLAVITLKVCEKWKMDWRNNIRLFSPWISLSLFLYLVINVSVQNNVPSHSTLFFTFKKTNRL